MSRRTLLTVVCPADHILVRVLVSPAGEAVVVTQLDTLGRRHGQVRMTPRLADMTDEWLMTTCRCQPKNVAMAQIRQAMSRGDRRVIVE